MQRNNNLFRRIARRLCGMSGAITYPDTNTFVVAFALMTDPRSQSALTRRRAARDILTPAVFAEMERIWLDLWFAPEKWFTAALISEIGDAAELRARAVAHWAAADREHAE